MLLDHGFGACENPGRRKSNPDYSAAASELPTAPRDSIISRREILARALRCRPRPAVALCRALSLHPRQRAAPRRAGGRRPDHAPVCAGAGPASATRRATRSTRWAAGSGFTLGQLILGPQANPIPILSSYSTLWALIALALLYCAVAAATIGRPARKWPIAVLVTAFFGLTYFFWYYAVTTEQYTSAVAWTLAVVLLAFRWERERARRVSAGAGPSDGRRARPQVTCS